MKNLRFLIRSGLLIVTIEYAVHEKTINYVRKESVLQKTVRKQMQLIKRHKMRPDTLLSRTLWQYRLSSFQGDTKLEIFVVKNQHNKSKILYFI